MTATLDVDLDTPPAVRQPPRWRARLPWLLFGTTLAALVPVLVVRLPAPAPAAPVEPGAPPTSRAIDYGGDGYTEGPHVLRDADEAITAVVLVVESWGDRPATCRLVVDGHEVVDQGRDGHVAVCAWAAG